MWTEYAIRSIKNNRIGSIFLALISFVSSAFLGFLSSLGYNLWIDHVNQIIVAEGSYTKRPEPLVWAFVFVIVAASLCLIFMIHNAFAIPMNSRIHQLGILQSVGATPKQIQSFLLEEALALCLIPIILGTGMGIGVSALWLQAVIGITDDIRTYEAAFHFPIRIAGYAFSASFLTVLISAWLPAKKVSKITPIAALGYGVEENVSKMHTFYVFSKLFGIYGELARKSLYARRKVLKTSSVSLVFAFTAFFGLLNIEVISGISTQRTFFERYRDKWDMTVTVPDHSEIFLDEIETISGVKNCIAYQKVMADTSIPESVFSKELSDMGLENLTNQIVLNQDNEYQFAVPIYILDDNSYKTYCMDHRIKQSKMAVVNIIWDTIHSTRRNRKYIPLINSDNALAVQIAGKQIVVNAYADEMPKIKEEFEQFSFTLIISESCYKEIFGSLPNAETIYNIFLTSADRDHEVQEQINGFMAENKNYTLESRAEKEKTELKMRKGYKLFILCFVGIIACIGIANVFSFTLGQMLQRKREFARYFSVGLSEEGMRSVLIMEAFIICFRPFIISLMVNVPILMWALHAAEITMWEYIANTPIFLMCSFIFVIFMFILLAYYLGGKKIIGCDLVEIIKDETML